MQISKRHKFSADHSAMLQRAQQDDVFRERWASSVIQVPLYHGSFLEFEEFSLEEWHPGNDLGSGLYLTNSAKDAFINYASPKSGDLEFKMERKIRELSALDDETLAREQLMHHHGAIYPAYVFMENPIVLDGASSTWIDWGYDEDDPCTLFALTEAFGVLEEEGCARAVDHIRIRDELAMEFPDGGRADRVIDFLRSSEGLWNATSSDLERRGWGSSHEVEIIRQALEHAGFDGFIDCGVRAKFYGRMKGIDAKTFHVIAFREDQVQSAFRTSWEPKPEPKENRPVLAPAGF